jgi:alpha-tubulin suppressor-like RCC1 family protein
VVLTNKGHVWAMGSNKSGELGIGKKYDDQGAPVFLKELSFAKIIEIRSGSFTAALSTENQLYVWGRGVFGDFHTPHRVKSFKNHLISDFQISNFGFAIVLTKLGAVYSWGSNNYGQLGLSDQEIREKPQKVALLENKKVEQISVGGGFVIALGQTEKLQNEIPKQASKSSISGASSDVNLKQNSSYYSTE